MYGIIWLCLIEILFLYFSPFDDSITVAVHGTLGVLIFALAFYISHKVQATNCPDRIKRITRTTRNLAILQGVLGLALAGVVMMDLATIYASIIGLLHLANSLAIITQASSSATAYDMWEEKEFQAAPLPPVQTT
jgi:hypothetical protein